MRFEKSATVAAHSFTGIVAAILTAIGRMTYWAGWPGIHLILQNSERTRVVLLSHDKRCLVVRPWLGDGSWKLPGGGISRGETPARAAARELKEEMGIDLRASSLVLIQGTDINEHGHVYGAQIFGAHLGTDHSFRLRSWELAEAAWVELDDALVGITDHDARQAVRLWASR